MEPFYKYLEDEILPLIVSNYFFNLYLKGYKRTTFMQELNTALTITNINHINKSKLIKKVKQILKEKYALLIISDKPLIIKRVSSLE